MGYNLYNRDMHEGIKWGQGWEWNVLGLKGSKDLAARHIRIHMQCKQRLKDTEWDKELGTWCRGEREWDLLGPYPSFGSSSLYLYDMYVYGVRVSMSIPQSLCVRYRMASHVSASSDTCQSPFGASLSLSLSTVHVASVRNLTPTHPMPLGMRCRHALRFVYIIFQQA